MNNDILEKGHNQGDIHPNGKWYWETNTKSGKPDWHVIPKSGQIPGRSSAAPTPAPAPTPKPAAKQPEEKVEEKPTPAAKKSTYDAPKPTVQYTNKPEIPYEVPEEYPIIDRTGKRTMQQRASLRAFFADRKKYDDTKLLSLLNNTSLPNANARHLAWEEAAARGIPESKIDVSGSLKNMWENHAERYKLTHNVKNDDDDDIDFGSSYHSALGNFDIEKFKAEFPDGDRGWENPNDPRVQKAFNKLITLKNRQQYDAAVDLLKREDPYYEGVEDQLRGLRIQFSAFIESSYKDGSAMFVSTGGAGAGKTTALSQVVAADGMKMYDPEIDRDDTAADIDVVKVDSDVDNEKEFFALLKKYNGKIIVFDDKDKLLVSDATKIKSAMKNIADGNYKERKIPGGGLFTGKLIFITNKTLDDLNKDEDHKAIMSRADKNDIHFTLNENLEVLEKRYKTMGGKMDGFTKQEEQDFRQKVYDTIIANVDLIDPMKFTVRKFSELLRAVVGVKQAAKKSESSAEFEALFGGKGSNSLKWRNQIMKLLNKAKENDLEKANSHSVLDKLTPAQILNFKKRYKADPKAFEELYGHWLVEFISEKSDDKEVVEKAIINDLGSSMSIEEAENLLLG